MLGTRTRRALGTAALTSAVFLLPLGAQAASASDATVRGGWVSHDGHHEHRDMCWRLHHGDSDRREVQRFRHRCEKRKG